MFPVPNCKVEISDSDVLRQSPKRKGEMAAPGIRFCVCRLVKNKAERRYDRSLFP